MHWLKDRCVEIMPRLKGLTGWKGSCVKRMYRLGSSCAESIYGLKGWIVEEVHGKKECIGWIDSWVERVHELKAYMGCKIHVLRGCQSHHVCVLGLEYHSCLPVSSCLCIKIWILSMSDEHRLKVNKWVRTAIFVLIMIPNIQTLHLEWHMGII